MKFAIVSHNFPPQNDAEALCTARLATSLVQAGFQVTVITRPFFRELDEAIEQELVDPAIKIIRVAPKAGGRLKTLALKIRYGLHLPGLDWVNEAIKTTRAVLKSEKSCILLTRAMPMASNLVGYYCRQYAKSWVAHFSDPYPILGWKHSSRLSPLALPLHCRWARRIIRSADLVTVTCANARRYIEERIGFTFPEKAYVLTHLALPKIQPGNFQFERKDGEFWLAHIGNLMSQRNPVVLMEGVLRAARHIPELRFLQYGNVDREVFDAMPKSEINQVLVLRHIENLSPREAADLQSQVDVNVIVDTDFSTDYSPLILSKYPHAVCAGRPLLMLTHSDSAMADYTRRFGGGIVASFRDVAAVETAILELHNAWKNGDRRLHPTQELMRQFAPETVALPFVEKIAALKSLRDSNL